MGGLVGLTIIPTDKDPTTRPTGPLLVELEDGFLVRIEFGDLVQWDSLDPLRDPSNRSGGQDRRGWICLITESHGRCAGL
jgi:hypothetical protein